DGAHRSPFPLVVTSRMSTGSGRGQIRSRNEKTRQQKRSNPPIRVLLLLLLPGLAESPRRRGSRDPANVTHYNSGTISVNTYAPRGASCRNGKAAHAGTASLGPKVYPLPSCPNCCRNWSR